MFHSICRGMGTAALLGLCVGARADQQAIYAPSVLAEWHDEFRDVLSGHLARYRESLSPGDRAQVELLRLYLPQDGEKWPFQFQVGYGMLEMPVASLMFLKDMAMAEAWLKTQQLSPSTLSDYMGALRHGRLSGVAPARRAPLAALGVPADAANDPLVLERRNDTLDKLLLFLIAHELGHLLQPGALEPQRRCQHKPPLPSCSHEALRASERAADEIAVVLMLRVGFVPNPAALLFALQARYQDGDAAPTHPVDADRVLALRNAIDQRADAFARATRDPVQGLVRLQELSKSLKDLADGLADPGLVKHQSAIARTLEPEDLLPRHTPVPTLRPGLSARFASAPGTGYHRGELHVGPGAEPLDMQVLWAASPTTGTAQIVLNGIRGHWTRSVTTGGRVTYVMDVGGDLYDVSFDGVPGEQPVEGFWRSRSDPAASGRIILRRASPLTRIKV